MDPQSNTTQPNTSTNQTSILGNLSLEEKSNLLKKVKKHATSNYEGIINEEDLSVAEKALDDYIKNTNK